MPDLSKMSRIELEKFKDDETQKALGWLEEAQAAAVNGNPNFSAVKDLKDEVNPHAMFNAVFDSTMEAERILSDMQKAEEESHERAQRLLAGSSASGDRAIDTLTVDSPQSGVLMSGADFNLMQSIYTSLGDDNLLKIYDDKLSGTITVPSAFIMQTGFIEDPVGATDSGTTLQSPHTGRLDMRPYRRTSVAMTLNREPHFGQAVVYDEEDRNAAFDDTANVVAQLAAVPRQKYRTNLKTLNHTRISDYQNMSYEAAADSAVAATRLQRRLLGSVVRKQDSDLINNTTTGFRGFVGFNTVTTAATDKRIRAIIKGSYTSKAKGEGVATHCFVNPQVGYNLRIAQIAAADLRFLLDNPYAPTPLMPDGTIMIETTAMPINKALFINADPDANTLFIRQDATISYSPYGSGVDGENFVNGAIAWRCDMRSRLLTMTPEKTTWVDLTLGDDPGWIATAL